MDKFVIRGGEPLLGTIHIKACAGGECCGCAAMKPQESGPAKLLRPRGW